VILVIDNYDSFAYNLVQAIGQVTPVEVVRNDAISIAEIEERAPKGIVISPGPGTPQEAGVSIDIFRELTIPTLGVCLGHQALCAAHGVPVGHAPTVVHGKGSDVRHDGSVLFAGIESPFRAGRYHSLAVERRSLPDPLVETAMTTDEAEIVMGVRARDRPHYGVQFHPESILTPSGDRLLHNFCRSVAGA
jgi:glutamine amidotransferase of anthranilate synthase or aminodeoxychorismate synthase